MRDDWRQAAWTYYERSARLGQFADLAADATSPGPHAVITEFETFTADVGVLAAEWDTLSEVERADRWTALAERHAERFLSMTVEEMGALDDDARIALLASLTTPLAASPATEPAAIIEPAPTSAPPDGRPVFRAATTPIVEPPAAEPAPAAEPEVLETIVAADAPSDARWHAIMFVEGVRTNDGREAAPGAISVRPLPLPLQYTTETTYGHEGAKLGGRIESLIRDPQLAERLAEGGFLSLADGALLLVAEGSYIEGDDGVELQGLVDRQELRFLSADIEVLEAVEALVPGGDPDNWSDYYMLVTRGNAMGATVCPFPAFQQCVIAPMSMDLYDAATQMMDDPANANAPIPQAEPVAVAAGGGPQVPPAQWFTDPRFGSTDSDDPRLVEDPDHSGHYYCPPTEVDGRVFGHAAAWHRDHIGYGGRRVRAPHSAADYAYFTTGTIVVDRDGSGDVVRCGTITMDTGHAPTSGANASAAATKRHYDDTGTAIADVEIGEDEHGIWYSGAIRADVPDEKMRAFRAASLSGDWRPINSTSELVGLLAVNVPGFPLPRPRRSYRVVDDEEVELALVAAGFVPPRDPMHDAIHREVQAQLAAHLAPFRRVIDVLTPLALDEQARRLDG